MIVQGRVQNGVVILEGGSVLPEGAVVVVSYSKQDETKPVEKKRVQVPLVHTGEPASVHLTGERIAEILDQEDAASGR